MRRPIIVALLVACGTAQAGIPAVTLADTAELRLTGISCFLLTILPVATGGVP